MGNIVKIQENHIGLIDRGEVQTAKGEGMPRGPFAFSLDDLSVYWGNDVCFLRLTLMGIGEEEELVINHLESCNIKPLTEGW